MNRTWNVTIFIEEDDSAASAHARLTSGNTLGHLVGHGVCRVTPTAVQDAGQRAALRALEDLSHLLDHVVLGQRAGADTGEVAAGSARPPTARSQRHQSVPPGLLSAEFHTAARSVS